MYDTILVPTDGSEQAETALTHAVALAERYGAALHVLYVVDTGSMAAAGIDGAAVLDELENAGEAIISRAVETGTRAGLDAEGAVEYGSPHEAIREYVDDHGIDLIVMGTHGRRGLGRYLLGSVTERVIRTASVPVLAVRSVAE